MVIDKVAASHFYKDDGDKILLNWFLYEYANNLRAKIGESTKLATYRKRRDEEDIVAFCVYFSKRLRRSIARVNEKKASKVELNGRYIYEFYPGNTNAQTQRLLEAAGQAWDKQLNSCSVCPNRCLVEGFERTDMFDNMEKTGWPTI